MQWPFQSVTETVRQLETHYLATFGTALDPEIKAKLSDETLVRFLEMSIRNRYPLNSAMGRGMSGTMRDGTPFKTSGFPPWMNMPGP